MHEFGYGTIWNRLVRANMFTKGLDLVDEYIINSKKNLWEDMWWNDLIDRVSLSNLVVNRLGYIYLYNRNTTIEPKIRFMNQRDKTIREFIYFWYFDYQLLPKDDNKKNIVKTIIDYNKKDNYFCRLPMRIDFLLSEFDIYERLLLLLINDPYVLVEDKQIINGIYNNYKIKKELFKKNKKNITIQNITSITKKNETKHQNLNNVTEQTVSNLKNETNQTVTNEISNLKNETNQTVTNEISNLKNDTNQTVTNEISNLTNDTNQTMTSEKNDLKSSENQTSTNVTVNLTNDTNIKTNKSISVLNNTMEKQLTNITNITSLRNHTNKTMTKTTMQLKNKKISNITRDKTKTSNENKDLKKGKDKEQKSKKEKKEDEKKLKMNHEKNKDKNKDIKKDKNKDKDKEKDKDKDKEKDKEKDKDKDKEKDKEKEKEKLMNYQNNTQIENLFLVNLILTIISVPILKFDPDLVICHSVLLDDDINSKYSILTVIKYIVQELSKEYLSDKDKIIEQNIIEKIKE